jgi:hypothetical protein
MSSLQFQTTGNQKHGAKTFQKTIASGEKFSTTRCIATRRRKSSELIFNFFLQLPSLLQQGTCLVLNPFFTVPPPPLPLFFFARRLRIEIEKDFYRQIIRTVQATYKDSSWYLVGSINS